MQTICPDRTYWQELLDGALTEDRQGVLEAHLDACVIGWARLARNTLIIDCLAIIISTAKQLSQPDLGTLLRRTSAVTLKPSLDLAPLHLVRRARLLDRHH